MIDDIKAWIPALLFLWNVCLTIGHFLRKPGEDAGAAVESLRAEHGAELAAIKSDVVAIKTELKHMPTSEELAELEGTVKQINARTEGMAENMSTVRSQLNRIENYLLNAK